MWSNGCNFCMEVCADTEPAQNNDYVDVNLEQFKI